MVPKVLLGLGCITTALAIVGCQNGPRSTTRGTPMANSRPGTGWPAPGQASNQQIPPSPNWPSGTTSPQTIGKQQPVVPGPVTIGAADNTFRPASNASNKQLKTPANTFDPGIRTTPDVGLTPGPSVPGLGGDPRTETVPRMTVPTTPNPGLGAAPDDFPLPPAPGSR
jgi:hypothetical protein